MHPLAIRERPLFLQGVERFHRADVQDAVGGHGSAHHGGIQPDRAEDLQLPAGGQHPEVAAAVADVHLAVGHQR